MDSRRLTLREAVIEAISGEMEMDPAVMVIGQDVRGFGGPLQATDGLAERFGSDRVIETPISEQGVTALGIGMGLRGIRPIVDIMFADFLPLVANELLQQAANLSYMTMGRAHSSMVVRTRGGDGPYRAHPQNMEALLSHVPGITVVIPGSPKAAKGLMISAIRSTDPVVFIEPIFLYQGPREVVPSETFEVDLGRAAILRTGSDVSLVGYGRTARVMSTAASQLDGVGISCEVIDLQTVAPLDEDTILASVAKTGRLVVAHDAWANCGIGAEVVARAASKVRLSSPAVRIAAPNMPIPYAPALRDEYRPTAGMVVEAVREMK